MIYFGMELDRLMILRSRWWSDYFPNFHDVEATCTYPNIG